MRAGSVGEVFLTFLRLGCLSFGGPVAHLGYFQNELVQRRQWVSEKAYADLVALCQFLPGPASSQVGFALGLQRAGYPGAFAAWVGFTLPSAVLMIGLALGLSWLGEVEAAGWLIGLKLVAVAVVANAVADLGPRLCPDAKRALVAIAAAVVLIVSPGGLVQIVVIAVGAVIGMVLLRGSRDDETAGKRTTTRVGWPWLVAFFILLGGLPVLVTLTDSREVALTEGFYRTGSLVFGGGHVVLPLLDTVAVDSGQVERDAFLAGYGAAQAMPGPLFSFAGFLGTAMTGTVSGGLLALTAIYLPSWLLVLGVMPLWERLRRQPLAQAALAGTNAAVVGLLLAALYDPIWVSAMTGPLPIAFGLVAFGLLRYGRAPAWAVVLAGAGAGVLLFA